MERVALKSPAGRWIIAATAMGSGMIFLDGTVVNVALPRIQTELAAPLSGLQWIVNGYSLYATTRHVPPNRDENASPLLDWPGALCTVVRLGSLTYALIEGPKAGWTSGPVIGAIVAAVVGFCLFPVREARARNPMVPLRV